MFHGLDSIRRFEARMRDAATAFAIELGRREIAASQACLSGIPLDRDVGCPEEILDALRREDGRLVRMARRNSPLYDLNRHIAVRRLVRRSTGAGSRPG